MGCFQFFTLFWTVLICISLHGQIVLSEVMYDPDTLEYYCEYIEIYNTSDQPVDLNGWAIGSHQDIDLILPQNVGNDYILQPEMYGLIIDPGYFEHNLNIYQYPDSNVLLLTISDASFGSGGLSNSSADTIILVNPQTNIVQEYQYSIDNQTGYSDEKIDFAGPNSDLNWANSLNYRGTPGYKNSVSISEYNLKIGNPEINDGALSVYIYNTGLEFIRQNIPVKLSIDCNFNSMSDASDHLIFSQNVLVELEPSDSVLLFNEIDVGFVGKWPGWIAIDFTDEQDSDNINWGTFNFNFISTTIVFNELMISPAETGEWIELLNYSDKYVSLDGLKMVDLRDTVLLDNLGLLPNEHLLLCQNESWAIMQQNLGLNAQKISWLTLNNSADHFKIIDSSGFIIDEAYYDFDEMGIEITNGYSLERIKPNYSGRDIWNWAQCVDVIGNTAGLENSVFFKPNERKKKLSVSPNPFSPDGDGYDDVCQILLQTDLEMVNAFVKVFSLNGRLVKKWDLYQVPGNYILIWNGKDNNGKKLPLGIYIIYAEMINRMNGKKIKEKKSLVIAYKK